MVHVKHTRTINLLSIALLLFSLIIPSGFTFAQSANHVDDFVKHPDTDRESKLNHRLLEQFDENDKVSLLIKFKEKANTTQVVEEAKEQSKQNNLSSFKAKTLQRSLVVSELKSTAGEQQSNALAYLEEEAEKGNAENIREYFIVNAIAVTTTKEVAERIADFDEVEKLLLDEKRDLITPQWKEGETSSTETEVEWNLDQVGAPEAWDLGYDGAGIVVASIDTGVQWDHPALKEKYRGYDAETGEVTHDFNWYDATYSQLEPTDYEGHGTHVTGTMVGSEPNGDNQIGVAPGAKWIAVNAFTNEGDAYDSDLLAAGEWILAPTDSEGNVRVDMAPDIVNNSWGGGPGLNEWYRDVVIEWRNAEIFPVFAAGNVEMFNPGYSRSVLSPANYPESFAVGATDKNDVVANFSLRGPSPYEEIKPDIAAPGVSILSSIPGNRYAISDGTSMAAPAVAGVIALILQADASLEVSDVEDFLIETATPLTDAQYPETPNNAYGHGLINAAEAVLLISNGIGTVQGKVVNSNDEPVAGEISILESKRSTKINSEDGTYKILHGIGEFTAVLEAYGYETEERTINIEENKLVELDFSLTEIPQATINGTITNEETGNIIEDAKVYLIEDANVGPTESDQNGQYEFTAYEGTYTVRVTAWNFISEEIEVSLTEDGLHLNIELEPHYTYPGGEIGYDDGTMDNAVYSAWDGAGWGVHMTLPEGQESAIVTDGVFLFDPVFPNSTATEFFVEVWDASGEDGTPGERIAGPFEANAVREEGVWTVVDLREHRIEVESDFYMVYVQKGVGYVPGLAYDEDSPYQGRSHRYDPVKGWGNVTFIGNYMIRARVAYDVDAPMITSPVRDFITNDKQVTIDGVASPTTAIQLMNNDTEIGGLAQTNDDGTFTISTELKEGTNELVAVSEMNGDQTGVSDPVSVVLDTIAPELTIDQPIDGGVTNKETVTVEGTATDNFELDWVKVNDIETDITNGKYSEKVIVQEGQNEIKITAQDKAGNKTTETITVEVETTAPNINQLQPTTDQTVLPGDKVDVSFTSDTQGGKATFEVVLPGLNTTQSATQNNMVETEPGVYKGEWTVPENIKINEAVIEVSLTDRAGNTTTKEAEGRLLISQDSVDRLSGKTRFDTAVEVSKTGWDDADTVVLARSDDYADALAGVPLAHQLDAPILLTRSGELMEATKAEIERLGAEKVIILGGTIAIDEAVSEALESMGLDVERISGKGRYETAVAIAEKMAPEGVNEAVIANGLDFPDALSIASQAAIHGMPILLTRPDRLPEETADAVASLGVSETLVVGGTVAISDLVMDKLPGAERVKGSDRIGTNIAIQEYFEVDTQQMYVATGNDYADALTGAVLAAKNDSSILLVRHSIADETAQFIKQQNVSRLTLFGGTIAISEEIKQDLEKLLK